MMRPHEIEGLTPQQIKDKFALPELPTFVSDVHTSADTKIRAGNVGTQPDWGAGGETYWDTHIIDHHRHRAMMAVAGWVRSS